MAQFSYKGKRKDGKVVTGQIQSDSESGAKNALLNRGVRPLKIVRMQSDAKGMDGVVEPKKGIGRYIYRDKSGAIQIRLSQDLPSEKELAVFTKQFSLMIENGVPLMQSLNLLKSQQKREAFAEVIDGVVQRIERGASLSDAMAPYPKVFDNLYVAMVRAGEASGRLDLILRQLVVYIDKVVKIKSQVKSAMAYPLIIVVVAALVMYVLLAFVVPMFAQQFKDNGQELPGLTQLVVDMSDWMVTYSMHVIGAFIAAIFIFKKWLGTVNGRKIFDASILKWPVIGEVLTKIAIGRFCSTMATLLTSGVSILEALTICASSSGNKRVESVVLEVKQKIVEGQTFADPLAASGLVPKMVSSMVAVGEATGTLDATLSKITEIYDDEVDNAVRAMTSMIEPAMIVIIGGMVGIVVIAMYLPVFDMATTIGG